MDLLLTALLAGGAISLGAYVARRYRAHRAREQPPRLLETAAAQQRGLDRLAPGDVLLVDNEDLVVAEVQRFSEHDRRWQECRVEADEGERWLVVEAESVRLGRPVKVPSIVDQPPESIDFDGVIYQLSGCGQATVMVDGADDRSGGPRSDVPYWNYRRVGDRRLWIRGGGADNTRCCVGRQVARHELEWLPGGGL